MGAVRRCVVVALVGAAALSAHGALAQAAARGHVLFGVYVKHTYGDGPARKQLRKLERALGRRVAVDHVGFYSWNERLPLRRMKRDLLHQRRPLLEWTQAPSNDILAGSQDPRITSVAKALGRLPGRVFLEYAGEMDRLPASGKPRTFIRAWLHVRSIFADAGATNALFVWCPTAYGFAHGRAADFYPGDDAVDWICADGYNWGTSRPTESWRSFSDIFTPFLDWAKSTTKPILIGEWASVRGDAGQRAAWITDAADTIKSNPQIRALSYFDTLGWDETTNQPVDWRVQTETSAFNAFKAMANDPYFLRKPRR